MAKEIFGLAIPGVRGDIGIARNILRLRRHPGLSGVEIFDAQWQEGEGGFRSKVDRLVDTIGKLRTTTNGLPIVLFEISAGGAIGEIATRERPEWIAANVLICARLKLGYTTLPTQQAVLDDFPAHAHAVAAFARDIEPLLSADERERHLAMIPEFDDVTPIGSMYLPDAAIFNMPNTHTHMQNISAAVTTHAHVIVDFAQRHA